MGLVAVEVFGRWSKNACDSSSPHARGWLASRMDARRALQVVPARAMAALIDPGPRAGSARTAVLLSWAEPTPGRTRRLTPPEAHAAVLLLAERT
ncbi:hypothetical protein [Streptomyces sp. SHP 1-2]|uniref:hypothetical protein n=1 Tax=Streptomyces sp. SHP 1-2 TaxID=2769489 RepID=UPI002237BDEF|nr:hypothetical protein [Streptomyces sp. SHP 1-2]MCW5251156.1 hypothetical protein [Streptomyces sp. SHP 1-2]